MPLEIERKFLLADETWRGIAEAIPYRQGYLSTHPGATVRVRTVGDKGFLTVKGQSVGISRLEFEYEIPFTEANAMLDKLCSHTLIEEKRTKIAHEGFIWEIDEFFGENQGLLVAEIELEREEQVFIKPPWVGKEVSGDSRYFNSSLIKHPYKKWSK